MSRRVRFNLRLDLEDTIPTCQVRTDGSTCQRLLRAPQTLAPTPTPTVPPRSPLPHHPLSRCHPHPAKLLRAQHQLPPRNNSTSLPERDLRPPRPRSAQARPHASSTPPTSVNPSRASTRPATMRSCTMRSLASIGIGDTAPPPPRREDQTTRAHWVMLRSLTALLPSRPKDLHHTRPPDHHSSTPTPARHSSRTPPRPRPFLHHRRPSQPLSHTRTISPPCIRIRTRRFPRT